MPYFSYLSMLHLYETLGFWNIGANVRRVHFSEEWNELQHLMIMEALGGDSRWMDRFLARHAAIVYYWALNALFLFSPKLAYAFSELIEAHAVDTYDEFAVSNKELLQSLPPPPEAIKYYCQGDMYLFDEFQTSQPAFSRRPVITNLYDVFCNIRLTHVLLLMHICCCMHMPHTRDDEKEHVKTMFACERSNALVTSPNEVAANAAWADTVEFDDDDQEDDVVEDVLTAADAVLDTAAEVAAEVAAAATAAAASTAAAAVVPPDDHVQA
eukprot:19710-Heterococcus_DN1.PRE.1